MFSILIIMKIYLIFNYSPFIIPFENNLNISYQNLDEFFSIVRFNFFVTYLYIGKPVQKIKNIGLLPVISDEDIKIVVRNSKNNDGYDIDKSNTINNYTYIRENKSEFMVEYAIFNDSIYLGNRKFQGEEYKKKFIHLIQFNQKNLYVPLNGFVFIVNSMYTIFEYFDSKKGVVINFNDYPHKYDLRYNGKDLESIHPNYIRLGNRIAYGINSFAFSYGNVVKLNYLYSSYFNLLYNCDAIYLDKNTFFYKCNKYFNSSEIKITIGDLVLDENDLVITLNTDKIILLLFGPFNSSLINLGILYTKKVQILKVDNSRQISEMKRYKTKNNINLPIITLEKIPFSNTFLLKEKSPDGNDIFPLRFLHKIDRNNFGNLNITITFKNVKSEFKIELYVILEDLIESLKKGILIEKFYEEKITSDILNFLVHKDKIIGKMIDDEKNYYLYLKIDKSKNNKKKYNSIECTMSINKILDQFINPNTCVSNLIGIENEVQFYFSEDSSMLNVLNNNDTQEIESSDQKRLFIHISLENSLDFAIINRTVFQSFDKIDYYKNSTLFETVEEYSDKIIIYKDIFNRNISDLMINIFTKDNKRGSTNKGYKIKYYIGKIFDYPYYVVPDDKKINYKTKIQNNILDVNITIPNVEKYIYGIYKGFPNSTFVIKIFELDINLSIDISRPIIFYEFFQEIFSTEAAPSMNKEIINSEIEGIKVNLDKKQYLIITYANVSETNDTVSYDSFLIKKHKKDSSAAIIIIIIIIIILFIIILYILYKKDIFKKILKTKNAKTEVMLEKEIQMMILNIDK